MDQLRKKSGHGSANTSYTDVRKAVTVTDRHSKSSRPAMTRRTTTQGKLGKSSRAREREMEDEHWLSDERESFPQFCMTCEKQIDEKAIYCSESCRSRDQHNSAVSNATPRSHAHSSMRTSPSYPFYAAGNPEPRDIIPRASPSRPNSMYISPPTSPGFSSNSHHHHQQQHTSAISALRSLAVREPSPPSPSSSSSYHTAMWPFSTSTRTTATSPSTSYGTTRPSSAVYSSTYDYGYTMTSAGTDERPLPSRRPGAYSRPKSIELVTPMVNSR